MDFCVSYDLSTKDYPYGVEFKTHYRDLYKALACVDRKVYWITESTCILNCDISDPEDLYSKISEILCDILRRKCHSEIYISEFIRKAFKLFTVSISTKNVVPFHISPNIETRTFEQMIKGID